MSQTGKIDCGLSCPIPEGYAVDVVPPPRHAWGDVKRCPNQAGEFGLTEDCGKFFLITKLEDGTPAKLASVENGWGERA